MAAAHNLEMGEDVNRNRDREMKEMLEEETVREDRAGKDPFKPKKVQRIVSKWMLPEPMRRTYLERANCLPPPVFIISISIAEVSVRGGGHWCKDPWGVVHTHWGFRSGLDKRLENVRGELGDGKYSTHRTRPHPLQSSLPRFFLCSQSLLAKG